MTTDFLPYARPKLVLFYYFFLSLHRQHLCRRVINQTKSHFQVRRRWSKGFSYGSGGMREVGETSSVVRADERKEEERKKRGKKRGIILNDNNITGV